MVHVEEDGDEVHYQLGMRTAFTVQPRRTDRHERGCIFIRAIRGLVLLAFQLRRRCGKAGACAPLPLGHRQRFRQLARHADDLELRPGGR